MLTTSLQILFFAAALAAPQEGEVTPAEPAVEPIPTVESEPELKDGELPPDPNRLEVGLLPAIAYSSDIGFGFGAITNIVQFEEGQEPYDWRLEALLYMTVKESPDGGGFEFPFHSDWVRLDIPNLWGGYLRLTPKVEFNRYINSGYYGIGNDTEIDEDRRDADGRTYQYDHISQTVLTDIRVKLFETESGFFELYGRPELSLHWINIFEGSKLQDDLAAEQTASMRFLYGTETHGLVVGNIGVIWDSRDHESVPTSGLFSMATLRGGTGFGDRFSYGGFSFDQRAFFSLWGDYLVLAGRVFVDLLFGNPPVHELSRIGGLRPDSGSGGAKSVRGVPANRYAAKIKVLGNLELRAKLLPFTIFGERFNVGLLAFADVGRYWADYRIRAALDGIQIGVKVGTGAGLRIQWGEHFVVRGDFGVSPTDGDMGVYIDVGHIF